MKKVISIIFSALVLASLFAFPVMAMPQEKVEAFVCPVINSDAVGEHNPTAVPLGDTGTYTVSNPTAHHFYVPAQATNMDGAGVPGGPQSQPGDTDYTAIWAVQ